MTALQNGNEWMSQMKLSHDIQTKLQEREVTKDELLEFRNDELHIFCKDMHFSSIQTARLLKAVQLLASNEFDIDQTLKTEEKKHANHETIYISQQEHDQYEALYKQQQTVNKLMQCINDGYNSLDVDYNLTIQHINSYFDALRQQLNNKEKELLLDIDKIHKYKTDGLQLQFAETAHYFEHVTKIRKDFEYFSNDSSMNQKRRTIKLQSMLHDVMKHDIKTSFIYKPYLQISDKCIKKLCNYFNKNVNISHCDTPKAPVINIKVCTFERNIAEIAWNAAPVDEFELKLTGFEVHFLPLNIKNHKTKRCRYYEDIEDVSKLYTVIQYIEYIFNQLKNAFIPSYLQKNKGKITKTSVDNKGMEILSHMRSSDWIKSEIINPNKRKYKLKQLKSNTPYALKIRASNSNGWSAFSEIIQIVTPPLKLTWKYSKNGHKYLNPLTESRMIIESNKYGNVYRLYGDNVLSKKNKNIFGVEFIVHKMSHANYGTCIGFIPYPHANDNVKGKRLGSDASDFCISMHFGMNYVQITCNASVTSCNLYSWPWHKTRNGDSFIFVMDSDNNQIQVYHNGVQINNIFQQLNSQQRKVTLPKKFVVAASVSHDQNTTFYYNKKKKRKYAVGDIEINYLNESDLSKFRMILRMMYYIFVPWFIRENIKFIVFMIIIFLFMWKYQ